MAGEGLAQIVRGSGIGVCNCGSGVCARGKCGVAQAFVMCHYCDMSAGI